MPEALIARGIARGLHVAASLSVFGSALCYANIAPIVLRQSSTETICRIKRLTSVQGTARAAWQRPPSLPDWQSRSKRALDTVGPWAGRRGPCWWSRWYCTCSATGAWLGGLAALLIVIDAVAPAAAWKVASRFSALGGACVLVLAATAAAQGWLLVGGIAKLFGTAYGRVAAAKLVLFVVLLGSAAANRFRFAPALDARGAQRQLHRSILAETLTGLLVVVLAGILLNLSPNMRMEH